MSQVIVIGSVNMDIIVRVAELPLPGATIAGNSVEYLAGGKGLNQAVACAKMGVKTMLAACLGNDAFADRLRHFILDSGINADYLTTANTPSGTAFINVAANGQNTIVVAAGSNAQFSPAAISALPINGGDIVICQFEIPLPTVAAAFRKAKTNRATTILNPSPICHLPASLLADTDILIVNETELGFLRGKNLSDDTPIAEIASAAEYIKTDSHQTVIVTLGHRGALIVASNSYLIDSRKVTAVDTVGAGDCFAGVTAAALLQGKSIKQSVQSAVAAAALCVTRKGAAPAMPDAAELAAFCPTELPENQNF